jgi:hypothetical protein
MELGPQVVVYGPDGTAYGNPQIAERAGVTNYTMTPPTQTPVQERQTMAETTPITPPTKGEQLIERLGEQVTGGDKTVPELGRVAPVQQELQQEEILTTPTSLAPVEVDASTALSNDLNVPTCTKYS